MSCSHSMPPASKIALISPAVGASLPPMAAIRYAPKYFMPPIAADEKGPAHGPLLDAGRGGRRNTS
eukprot:CAMPEP_0170406612 /NCGR_PEP_ID=MMETSP0117_2-20130122/27813_1 /TAXON_ID=400756 /ORGANISM="Durinskia baltica, Strain CSIRO CS-38" /LENGTH=65 /DNA_ID=CAMNT_0010663817 /DNA_START=73 /DNA_END=267 /DNA_ORIENTATION=-